MAGGHDNILRYDDDAGTTVHSVFIDEGCSHTAVLGFSQLFHLSFDASHF